MFKVTSLFSCTGHFLRQLEEIQRAVKNGTVKHLYYEKYKLKNYINTVHLVAGLNHNLFCQNSTIILL